VTTTTTSVKRARVKEQARRLKELRRCFVSNRFLTREQCAEVAQRTTMTVNQVRWWWQRERRYVALVAAARATRLPPPLPYHPFTEPQNLHELRRCFVSNRHLSHEQCAEVAQRTMITTNQVRWWWQKERQYVALVAAANRV